MAGTRVLTNGTPNVRDRHPNDATSAPELIFQHHLHIESTHYFVLFGSRLRILMNFFYLLLNGLNHLDQ